MQPGDVGPRREEVTPFMDFCDRGSRSIRRVMGRVRRVGACQNTRYCVDVL